MPPLILNTNLIKQESKIGYHRIQFGIQFRIDWELAVITTTLCLTDNGESLKILYTHT